MGNVSVGENGQPTPLAGSHVAPKYHKPPKPPYRPPKGPPKKDPLAPWERGASNTAADQATQIVIQFLSIMGYPAGLDATKLAIALLQNNLELSPEQAYNWLFTQLSPTLQKANPNAEFGMTKDAYTTTFNALVDAYSTLTGATDVPPDVLRMAIDQQWTQAELTEFLRNDSRYSNPAQLPWLQQGMTFRDVRNQFYQTYGHNPTDPTQLASWFNFRVGAQQVGGGQVASQQASQGPVRNPLSQSEIR